MSTKTVVTIICDKCGFQVTNNEARYHAESWLSITVEYFSRGPNTTILTNERHTGSFCPSCVKVYGKTKLIPSCLNVESRL